jgi:hypothetical protein
MNDIVERLRLRRDPLTDGERAEAADEIERLRDARSPYCVVVSRETLEEFNRLRAFIDEAFQVWPYGDWSGGALQDALVRHGFLALKDPPPREPCGPDCLCAESYLDDEFAGGDVQCYYRVR